MNTTFDHEYCLGVKFLLYCSEELSGMKINYLKADIYRVGLGDSPISPERINVQNSETGSEGSEEVT